MLLEKNKPVQVGKVIFTAADTFRTEADDPSLTNYGDGMSLVGEVQANEKVFEVYSCGVMRYVNDNTEATNGGDLAALLLATGHNPNNAGLEAALTSGAIECVNNCWYEFYERGSHGNNCDVSFSIAEVCAEIESIAFDNSDKVGV